MEPVTLSLFALGGFLYTKHCINRQLVVVDEKISYYERLLLEDALDKRDREEMITHLCYWRAIREKVNGFRDLREIEEELYPIFFRPIISEPIEEIDIERYLDSF